MVFAHKGDTIGRLQARSYTTTTLANLTYPRICAIVTP
jgi:hypothetical protein